jgi:hypothetical protein
MSNTNNHGHTLTQDKRPFPKRKNLSMVCFYLFLDSKNIYDEDAEDLMGNDQADHPEDPN